MRILVTGGAGYIGSHTCIELLMAGYELVVVDNLSNSCQEPLKRIEKLTKKIIPFYNLDLRDEVRLINVFERYKFDGVIHFAGLKSVGESTISPLKYHHNNVSGSLVLASVMKKYGCKMIVFSSSATVYGDPDVTPIKENFPLTAVNPYGRSKLIVEEILEDIFNADKSWSIGLLRYFNPMGAHKSGLIGEDPNGVPNNLCPFISKVAVGRLKKLSVFGGDYDTPDGTGIRDYIHVVDLAKGHVKALISLMAKPQLLKVNLGTGQGYSVLEVIKAFESASGKIIPYEIVQRREGDIAECYSDPSYALKTLDWVAKKDLSEMCEDAWRWQINNPVGYSED